ncbi:MAG: hypothetical protein AAGB15_10995 [Pseudomonadota bacterium]
MKIVALSLMAIGATGSAWAWLGPDLAGPREAPEVAQARAKAGARQMLTDHPELEFRNLVIGRVHPSALVDFRGRLLRHGRLNPAYGQVRPVCEYDRDQPSCWEIAHIEVDGEAISDLRSLVTATAQKEPPAAAPLRDRPAGGEVLGGAIAMNVTALPPKAPDVVETPEAKATHRVARPVINARSGPGTDHPVVAKLRDGVRLQMMEGQADWGRFVVLDSEIAGQEVWAALRILEEVE